MTSEAYTNASYFLGNPNWLFGVVFIWMLIAILTVLSYRGSKMPTGIIAMSAVLKLLGVGLLLACLLEPMLRYEVAKPHANVFGIVVDRSQSVRELWKTSSQTEVISTNRPAASAHLSSDISNNNKPEKNVSNWLPVHLRQDSDWINQLSKGFQIKRYTFGEELKSVDSFESVTWDSGESALIRSLDSLKNRINAFQSSSNFSTASPMAGLLLFTDGQATDANQLEQIRNFPIPIYPVVRGERNLKPDIAIQSVMAKTTDFETSPVTIVANLVHHGFDQKKVKVRLETPRLKSDDFTSTESEEITGSPTNANDTGRHSEWIVVEEKEIQLPESHKVIPVEFQFRPQQFGVQGYRVLVSPAEAGTSDHLLQNIEGTLHNNARFQIVHRRRGPHKVLYFAGRPNWEFKFLSRALNEDEEIDLTAIIRIAKKEAKFNFRAAGTDDSNSLFSGFDDLLEEEKEQFDEPVFVKIGGDSDESNYKGFPRDLKELFAYKTIILDEVDSELLTQSQQLMLRSFVRTRGGGLIALGGTDFMKAEQSNATPLGQLLPVYGNKSRIEDLTEDAMTTNPNEIEVPSIKMELSREGWLQPFMRLASNESDEKDRLNQSPTIQVWNRIGGIKPGATTLALGRMASDNFNGDVNSHGEDGSHPLFVTQRFGRGRTAAFMVGDWWRWGMHNTSSPSTLPSSNPIPTPTPVAPTPPMLYQAWRQMIRWAMTDTPEFTEFTNEAIQDSTHARRLTVHYRDHLFSPIENAEIQITVTAPNGDRQQLRAEPSAETPGSYEATVLCKVEGIYKAIAECSLSSAEQISSGRKSSTPNSLDQKVTLETGWAFEPLVEEFKGLGENLDLLERLASESGGRVLNWNELSTFSKNVPVAESSIKETIVFPIWHQAWVLALAIGSLCIDWGVRRRYGMA